MISQSHHAVSNIYIHTFNYCFFLFYHFFLYKTSCIWIAKFDGLDRKTCFSTDTSTCSSTDTSTCSSTDNHRRQRHQRFTDRRSYPIRDGSQPQKTKSGIRRNLQPRCNNNQSIRLSNLFWQRY